MPDPVAVNSMFARIAARYDVANRLLSGGLDLWWRRQLVAAVCRGTPTAVLDLATGSGDVAFALSRRLPSTTPILGMDFCQPMLDAAAIKKSADGVGSYANVSFRQGDGLALPCRTRSATRLRFRLASGISPTATAAYEKFTGCCARVDDSGCWNSRSHQRGFVRFISSI